MIMVISPVHRTMSRLQCLSLKSVLRQLIIVTAGKSGIQACLSVSTRHYSKLSNWGTKKSVTHVKLVYFPEGMADPQVEQILAPLRAAVKKQVSAIRHLSAFDNIYKLTCVNFDVQGDLVRSLKENNAADMEVKKAVGELKVLKKQLDDKELSLQPTSETFNRSKFADLMIRRFFYDQSFSIYGGMFV